MDTIPNGVKKNVSFVIRDDENKDRRARGKNAVYADDCGVCWDSKRKNCWHVLYKKWKQWSEVSCFQEGRVLLKKSSKRRTIFEKFEPQVSPDNIIQLCRYYTTLKRCNSYKRRILQDLVIQIWFWLSILALTQRTHHHTGMPFTKILRIRGLTQKYFKQLLRCRRKRLPWKFKKKWRLTIHQRHREISSSAETSNNNSRSRTLERKQI